MKKTLVFDIKTDALNGLLVHQIDANKINPIADNIECLDSFTLAEITYLMAFEKSTQIAHIYQVYNTDGTYMKEITQHEVSFNASSIAMLTTEEMQLCLAYDALSGNVTFLKILSDLTLEQIYQLNTGTGISTLKTFIYRKQYFFIAYNMATGSVAKYEVDIDQSSLLISVSEVWNDKWAQGWTRFSFFQLGAENFFIKTNLNYNKVNIDHFMDDPNEGSHPVLNIDAPSQMIGLNNVNAFVDPKGFPYFATYRTNGATTFNRIYGNCLGWDTDLQLNTESNRTLMLPLNINNKNYLLIY